MTMRIFGGLALAALLSLAGRASAQQPTISDPQQATNTATDAVTGDWKPSLVRDGVVDRTPHSTRVLAWQPVRENDVLWRKRVWREIDTRERQNQAFRFPGDDNTGGGFYIEILMNAVKNGRVKAYSGLDDRFTTAMTRDAIMEQLAGKPDTSYVEDAETGQTKMVIVQRDFNPDAITRYRIKEDWIMDRNLGRMVVRIIGIAPYIDRVGPDGEYRGSAALFWLYYPEVREVNAQYEVYNPENDAARMTWDEFFESRQFASRIVKVSNPFDANFRELGMSNMEQLHEAQRAQEEIFNREHDMWVY
jgi:gliding motility associated protien GldN